MKGGEVMIKVIEKIKNSKLAKIFASSALATAVGAMGVICASATDGETSEVVPSAGQALGTALNGVQADLLGYIGIVLPIALAIFGAIWGIRKAISFFRSTAR